MKVSFLLLATCLCFVSFKSTIATAQNQPSIKLNTFSNSPVNGCADYFYLSKVDGEKQRFICARDFAQEAYLKINGKMEKMIYKSGKSLNDATYHNSVYSVNIKVLSKKPSGPESYRIRATLTLYHNGVVISTQNVLGFGGC